MSITDLTDIPADINKGVVNAKQATMLATLGNPRDEYTADCQGVTDPRLRALIAFEDVGPFKARGLKLAVDSIRGVFQEIALKESTVSAGLGNMGMLCARLVRGSAHAISNHSWGTAIDLTLNGVLDRRGDNKVQQGLVAIAPIFNAHGWFWGAGFGTEDGMHFEVGDDLIRKWHGEGRFGGTPTGPAPVVLTMGDRGPQVVALQQRLNDLGAHVTVDGVFGTGTRAALMALQAAKGVRADGVAGPDTLIALAMV